MLSYFGCDQSQVQRYLTAKSVDEGRTSLMMSAYWKIPLQVLVLLVGVFTFVYYIFHPPPMLFNAVHDREVRSSARAGRVSGARGRVRERVYEARREAALRVAANGRRAATPPRRTFATRTRA